MKLFRLTLAVLIPVVLVSCSTHKADYGSTEQEFKRVFFNYEEMVPVDFPDLDPQIDEHIQNAYIQLERLNSIKSVELMAELYYTHEKNPYIDSFYSYCLFNNGQWMEAIKIIDESIAHFGSHPFLIHFRYSMSLIMAEMGIYKRPIDGMMQYLAKSKALPYDDEQFKMENLKSALSDALFLLSGSNHNEELMRDIALIYIGLQDYENSNVYLGLYSLMKGYSVEADFMMASNNIKQSKFDEAEEILLKLKARYPRSADIYDELVRLYVATGNYKKADEYQNKSEFFSMIPDFLDIDYDKNMHDKIVFFNSNNPAEEKFQRYHEFCEGPLDDMLSISAIILYCHNNHGNGMEELIVEKMIELGEKSIPTMLSLFQTPGISTCTITQCCEVFSALKDPQGWDAMVDYLPEMVTMPSTLISPRVAENLIAFDERNGAKVIITVIKIFLLDDEVSKVESDNPLQGFSFSKSSLFSVLSDLPRETVIEIALEDDYSDYELELLLQKVYR